MCPPASRDILYLDFKHLKSYCNCIAASPFALNNRIVSKVIFNTRQSENINRAAAMDITINTSDSFITFKSHDDSCIDETYV